MKIYHSEESSYIPGEIREDTGDRGAIRGIENDRRGGPDGLISDALTE